MRTQKNDGQGFSSLKEILSSFKWERKKYITREFQDYGYRLAKGLDDLEHKSLYIKLAKETPRRLLEEARNFVKDQDPEKIKSKARLFMWKLKQLKEKLPGDSGKGGGEIPRVFIGTSGFSYSHWAKGVFYPQGLPQAKWFEYYCQHFKTIELNVSFYRLPKREVFEGWRAKAGPDFVFSLKGSRLITHIKRLKDCQEAGERFFKAAGGLKTKKGFRDTCHPSLDVVLWQLPPNFKLSSNQAIRRLGSFLKLLPKNWRYAFEFRHESWFLPEVLGVIKRVNAKGKETGVVFQDFPGWFVCDGKKGRPTSKEVLKATKASFVYLRLHGKRRLYTSCYTEKELEEWARKIGDWQKRGLDCYVYFNNDALGYAVENAKTLISKIKGQNSKLQLKS